MQKRQHMTDKAHLPGAGTPLSLWVASYQNHVLYLSAYVAIFSFCFDYVVSGEGGRGWYMGFSYAVMSLSVLATCHEVLYILRRRRLPPGDSGLPIVGHFPLVILQGTEAFVINRFKKYGNRCTHSVFGRPAVLFTESEDVNWLMTMERKGKTNRKTGTASIRKLLGEESIFLQSGEHHKRLRKIFEPAFTPLAIRDSAATIDALAQEMLAKWCESGEWKASQDWAVLALRIFMTCAFGEADKEKLDKLTFLFENWMQGFTSLVPINFPGTPMYRATRYGRELCDEMSDMIKAFKAQNPPDSEAAQKSVMGRLCYATDDDGNPPTQEQLVHNLRFFLVAGFDTTKATFGAISHFMKENARTEALLVEEVRTLTNPLDVDELKHEAPILNAVLAETWRLTAPLVGHSLIASEDLHYKGYVIPKGCFAWADIQGHAMLNDSLYPRASEFHYERWLPKDHPLYDPAVANTETIDYNVMNSKFRTFNMGPHMCLGGHFAKLEVRIVVTRLFQKYCIEIRNERFQKLPTKQILNEFKLTKRP